ncbi:MAG TPA: hypothetical protein PLP19_21580 [bacterium]|nr:hypothetical protein [bacterium]HPN46090.1 hypothetical protein [bacterium]
MNNFEDFYKSMGLTEYPFSTYTTENEKGKEEKLFVSPACYAPIIQNYKEKNTILLTGDRGTGKTAILLDFMRNTDLNSTLFCRIDDYSNLSENFHLPEFYKFLITNISVTLFDKLSSNQNRIRKLCTDDKVLLSYLLKNFVPIVSKRLLKTKIEKIQIPCYKRIFIKILNILRPIINYGATAGGVFIEEYIAKHFKTLPPLEKKINIKDYFPELPLTIDEEFQNIEIGYQLINDLVTIVQKLGYNRVLCLLDKLDEDSRLENDAEYISSFVEPILTDNKLLLNDKLQLIVSLWITPFNFLLKKVRTQKHYCPKLQWEKIDLEHALNARLNTYSNSRIIDYKVLFESNFSKENFELLFELANSNPRDLWHLLDKLFNIQYSTNPESKFITSEVLPIAIEKFITDFNYFEYYPRKKNARSNTMDFYSFTAHLLTLDDYDFTKNKLNELAGTGGSTNNYVVGMERIGLIVKYSQEGGNVHYRIKDPKVKYALNNDISIERKI